MVAAFCIRILTSVSQGASLRRSSMRAPSCIALLVLLPLCIKSVSQDAHPQKRADTAPTIPKTWDDEAMATLELPLANPIGSPKHVPAEYYYRIPVRPIYKTYAVYAAG